MSSNAGIRERAQSLGVDFFGVADLSAARDEILAQGGAEIAAYPRAVSVGVSLMDAIVDRLPDRAQRAVAVSYKRHGYEIVNQRLDFIASNLASFIQRAGFRALPIPAAERVDDQRICASFSHKLAANLAGLGWIGKSCLLVTPERGPRVRWTSVLTDAPFDPTGMPMPERCGSCAQCVTICPVGAFTGEPFRALEPRGARFDASACDLYFKALKQWGEETAVCGMCLYACPFGKKQGSAAPR